jgi:hypothetical protein
LSSRSALRVGDRHDSLYCAVKYPLNKSSKLSFKSVSFTSGITGQPSRVSISSYLDLPADFLPAADGLLGPAPFIIGFTFDFWVPDGPSPGPLPLGSNKVLTYSMSFNWSVVVSSSCKSINERRFCPAFAAISSCLARYRDVSKGPTRHSAPGRLTPPHKSSHVPFERHKMSRSTSPYLSTDLGPIC